MENVLKILLIVALFIIIPRWIWGQNTKVKIALLKYKEGEDCDVNPVSLLNLIRFCNKNLNTGLAKKPAIVEAGSREIFNYPFVHMAGHGKVVFTPVEVQNLRDYLLAGGFLHVDDNCRINEPFRQEMKKVFPDDELTELPWDHPVFNQSYKFQEGLPKIQGHGNKHPQAFGIVKDGRLVVLYTAETDLVEKWKDSEIPQGLDAKQQEALKMGANIISYAFMN